MKENLQTIIVFAVLMAIIPCLAFIGVKNDLPEHEEQFAVGVLFCDDNRVENYTLEEYLIGAVLAQMPADFEPEALKAQAVLARSYISRRFEAEKLSPTEGLKGALISDDGTVYQAFFTEEQARSFYGDEYENAYRKAAAAVRAAPYILTYQGEPVIAAFHAASSGSTESALTAWGVDIPYLQSAQSAGDSELGGIETTTTLTLEELAQRLQGAGYVITDEENIFTLEANERGYVTAVSVCGEPIGVQQLTGLLNIASPCFTYEISGGQVIFTAKGFGHMVGLSQYGANAMAKAGSSFEEILAHYYQGCTLVEK